MRSPVIHNAGVGVSSPPVATIKSEVYSDVSLFIFYQCDPSATFPEKMAQKPVTMDVVCREMVWATMRSANADTGPPAEALHAALPAMVKSGSVAD